RRARQVLVAGTLAYLAVTAAFHALLGAGVVVARLQDRRPRPPLDIHLENLRRVDERVWASAQPDDLQYAELGAAGVHTVVDLRTGEA
ncbi:hypothetical protein MRO55_25360, partial [Escherichia coli]|uniref:hypothetical protein n=1 Tax=Escherichia coli TaxID=562 RepID=UPI002114C4EF